MGKTLRKPQTLEKVTLKLDLDTSIRKALRIMIDNNEYSAQVVDGEDIISEINVSELREAICQGLQSSTTIQQLLLGKIFREIFFKQDE